MRKLIYISGTISSGGTSNPEAIEENVKRYIESAVNLVKGGCDYVPILSAVNNHELGKSLGWEWEDYMLHDLPILMRCDAIYMTRGWEESRGANTELLVAKVLGLEIIYEEN